MEQEPCGVHSHQRDERPNQRGAAPANERQRIFQSPRERSSASAAHVQQVVVGNGPVDLGALLTLRSG
eukprot:6177956-Pleurochrysis_carterae.AAC.2